MEDANELDDVEHRAVVEKFGEEQRQDSTTYSRTSQWVIRHAAEQCSEEGADANACDTTVTVYPTTDAWTESKLSPRTATEHNVAAENRSVNNSEKPISVEQLETALGLTAHYKETQIEGVKEEPDEQCFEILKKRNEIIPYQKVNVDSVIESLVTNDVVVAETKSVFDTEEEESKYSSEDTSELCNNPSGEQRDETRKRIDDELIDISTYSEPNDQLAETNAGLRKTNHSSVTPKALFTVIPEKKRRTKNWEKLSQERLINGQSRRMMNLMDDGNEIPAVAFVDDTTDIDTTTNINESKKHAKDAVQEGSMEKVDRHDSLFEIVPPAKLAAFSKTIDTNIGETKSKPTTKSHQKGHHSRFDHRKPPKGGKQWTTTKQWQKKNKNRGAQLIQPSRSRDFENKLSLTDFSLHVPGTKGGDVDVQGSLQRMTIPNFMQSNSRYNGAGGAMLSTTTQTDSTDYQSPLGSASRLKRSTSATLSKMVNKINSFIAVNPHEKSHTTTDQSEYRAENHPAKRHEVQTPHHSRINNHRGRSPIPGQQCAGPARGGRGVRPSPNRRQIPPKSPNPGYLSSPNRTQNSPQLFPNGSPHASIVASRSVSQTTRRPPVATPPPPAAAAPSGQELKTSQSGTGPGPGPGPASTSYHHDDANFSHTQDRNTTSVVATLNGRTPPVPNLRQLENGRDRQINYYQSADAAAAPLQPPPPPRQRSTSPDQRYSQHVVPKAAAQQNYDHHVTNESNATAVRTGCRRGGHISRSEPAIRPVVVSPQQQQQPVIQRQINRPKLPIPSPIVTPVRRTNSVQNNPFLLNAHKLYNIRSEEPKPGANQNQGGNLNFSNRPYSQYFISSDSTTIEERRLPDYNVSTPVPGQVLQQYMNPVRKWSATSASQNRGGNIKLSSANQKKDRSRAPEGCLSQSLYPAKQCVKRCISASFAPIKKLTTREASVESLR